MNTKKMIRQIHYAYRNGKDKQVDDENQEKYKEKQFTTSQLKNQIGLNQNRFQIIFEIEKVFFDLQIVIPFKIMIFDQQKENITGVLLVRPYCVKLLEYLSQNCEIIGFSHNECQFQEFVLQKANLLQYFSKLVSLSDQTVNKSFYHQFQSSYNEQCLFITSDEKNHDKYQKILIIDKFNGDQDDDELQIFLKAIQSFSIQFNQHFEVSRISSSNKDQFYLSLKLSFKVEKEKKKLINQLQA